MLRPPSAARSRTVGDGSATTGSSGSRSTAGPCVAYPGLTGPVALGDDVLVNVQAVELGLGTGGYDVLHANLTRGLDLAGSPAPT